MTIILNGQEHEAPEGATVLAFLETIGLAARRVAVEVNGTIVKRDDLSRRTLGEHDRVEVVQFVGGG